MLHVVLDANAVGIRAPMAANANQLLLQAAARKQLVLVVPELVVREVVNKWAEKSQQQLDKLLPPVRELAKYDIEVTVPTADELRQMVAVVEERTRRALDAAGVIVPDFPNVSHEAVAARALARRQPFDRRGKDGYRDTLLWENVLEIAAAHDTVLVSNDTRAFQGEGESLSDDLADEVRSRLGEQASIELVLDPAHVANRVSEQDQAVFDAVREMVLEISFRHVFYEALDEALAAYAPGPAFDAQLELDVTVLYASIGEPDVLGAVIPVAAYRGASGEALVDLDAWTTVGVDVVVSGADALSLRGSPDAWPRDFDWDDLRTAAPPEVWLRTYRYGRVRAEAAIEVPSGRIRRLAPDRIDVVSEDDWQPAADLRDA